MSDRLPLTDLIQLKWMRRKFNLRRFKFVYEVVKQMEVDSFTLKHVCQRCLREHAELIPIRSHPISKRKWCSVCDGDGSDYFVFKDA